MMKKPISALAFELAEAVIEYFRVEREIRNHRCAIQNKEEYACRFTNDYPEEDWCDYCKSRKGLAKLRSRKRAEMRRMAKRLEKWL